MSLKGVMKVTVRPPVQVATVTVVGGPVVPRPQEGWTQATADTFCSDYIRYRRTKYFHLSLLESMKLFIS